VDIALVAPHSITASPAFQKTSLLGAPPKEVIELTMLLRINGDIKPRNFPENKKRSDSVIYFLESGWITSGKKY
jgi:hypothetical protein